MQKLQLVNNDLFIKNARLSFQVVKSLELTEQNLEFLELMGSDILSGYLKRVSFFNASFLSTKFSGITFEKCNLKNTDICSVWANKCVFKKTDFSNATISDSTFIKCTFEKSIFNSISLIRCQFIDCIFEQFLIDDSTFALNTYIRCYIKKTHFTESFYYQIFEDCTFHEAHMNPNLLGFNFGFSPSTSAQLTNKADLSEIDINLRNNGLYINAAIFRINQVQNYYDEAMIACVLALQEMLKNDILIKADEIEFLKNLTAYFQENKLIAPISIIRIWQVLNNCVTNNISYNVAINKAIPHIREYTNMLYFSFIDFQNTLQQNISHFFPITDINSTAELKIVYLEKPDIPLLDYLIEFTNLISKDCPMPNLIRTEKGSFLEFHKIAIAIIPYIQTFFSLLSVIAPFIIYKKQKKDLKLEKQEENITPTTVNETLKIEITLNTTKPSQSPIFLPNTSIIAPDTNTIISDVIKIVDTQQKINGAGFSGYNSQNVQSITISFQ